MLVKLTGALKFCFSNFQAVCTEFLIRYPDLIFAETLPTFSTHTFELGIIEAGNNETEIDIDREIEKRSLNLATTTTSQVPKVEFKLPNRRPKSLAITTTSPLMSELEMNSNNSKFFAISNERNDCSKFIEVGGGPSALPAKYHTEVKLRRAKSSTLAGSCVDQRQLDNNNRSV